MHKYIFVVQTNSPLARMIKLVGKMEKIINDWGYEVKFISVEEVEGENGQGTNKTNC